MGRKKGYGAAPNAIDHSGEVYNRWMQAKRELGFNVSNIIHGIKKRKGAAYGYRWEYAN
jgi:hypothetical protein